MYDVPDVLPAFSDMMRSAIAYLKAGLPRKPRYQPFRNTYGIAVWLATPIKPPWGFVAPQTWASLCLKLGLRCASNIGFVAQPSSS